MLSILLLLLVSQGMPAAGQSRELLVRQPRRPVPQHKAVHSAASDRSRPTVMKKQQSPSLRIRTNRGRSEGSCVSKSIVSINTNATRKMCIKARAIYYLHFHKAGGTTMCTLATTNGQCIPKKLVPQDEASFFGKNCNPSQIDANLALGASTENKALRYILARGVNWIANEWVMPPVLFPQIFHYVVTFRSPISRVFSHCGSHRPLDQLELCALSPDQWNFATTRLAACDMSWRLNSTQVSPCPQDQLIRSPFRYWVPSPFKTTLAAAQFLAQEPLLEAAKARLKAFDTILILERFHEAPSLLQNAFHWTKSIDIASTHKGTHQNTPQRVAELKSLSTKLERYNQNDLQLYAYANELFELQLRAAASSSSLSGPKNVVVDDNVVKNSSAADLIACLPVDS